MDNICFSKRKLRATRRQVLQAGATVASVALLPTQLLAAGPSLATGLLSSEDGGVAAKVSAGSNIPAATVRLGIEPYGDHSILVIGIRRDFYKDVGITIDPQPLGESIQGPDVVPRLATNMLDVVTWYAPLKVATLPQTPSITMMGFHDVYIGTYILAAPWTKARRVSELQAGGKSFTDAMAAATSQMKGKRIALANDGAHRDFFNNVFVLGGLAMSDVTLQALPDNQQVQLANSQRLDFASPSGAAQTVELMNQGWYSIVGTEDLLKGLPRGDKRAVATIGNTGPACTLDFLEKNYETALRFMSVQFRIIDEIRNHPDATLAIQAPYLQAVAGTSTTAKDLGTIMSTLDPLHTFEEQTQFWTDQASIYYYKNVFTPQIEAAQAGGLIPPGRTFTPDDVSVGAGVYRDLVALKKLYDTLLPTAKSAPAAKLTAAATQYANRNYLDAYRILKTSMT